MDLKDRQVAVSDKNDSRMGPSGRRARSASSFYLLVGGSKDIYDVTVNFTTAQGHWCQKITGERCHGNGNGKSRTYGKPSERNKENPQHWCKHVQAALADTEALAEAQERTAVAFGKKPATVKAEPVAPVSDDKADRLRALDAQREALLAEIAAEEQAEVRQAVAALIEKHGSKAVNAALKAA